MADESLIAPEGEYLTQGWEPDLPAEDSIQRQSLLCMADRAAHVARAEGRAHQNDDGLALSGSADAPAMWLNWAIAIAPVDDAAALAAATSAFYGEAPHILLSAVPTVDLRPAGYGLVGHPPLMLRPAGLAEPSVADLDIRVVETASDLEAFERVFIEGYPAPELEGSPPGTLFPPSALEPSEFGELRFYLGWLDGEPVATSAAFLAHGAIEVEFVSAVPAARGTGFGAAITWAATAASEAPAILIASDMGQPVYDRLGYVRLSRWTVWAR